MAKSIFRTKLFGYSREDVASYIEKLNRDVVQEISDAEKKSERMRVEADGLRATIDSLNTEVDRLTSENLRIGELESIIEVKSAEYEAIVERLAEAEDNLARLKADYDSLSARFTALSAEAEDYQKNCREAGNVLMLAQGKASEVTSKASDEAVRIIAAAKSEAQEIISRAKAEAYTYSEKTKSEADEYAVKVRADADEAVEKSKEKVEYLIRRQRQLVAALQSQRSEIAKFYDDTVSGITGSSGSSDK